MIAESLGPLQAEVMALKEKLARADANRSRFEVSLSSIPPELEQQLEVRLRKELGPRVLEETRQQATQLLAAAKATIDQRTSGTYEDFVRRVADEFQAFEQRAQEVSGHISENVREQLRASFGEFQQRFVDGNNRLKRTSTELLEYLQHSLNEEHNARCRELEQLRVAVASESSRLQQQSEYLDGRLTTIYESACRLESGLDKRLAQMASDTVDSARSQLESMANKAFQESTTRNAQTLGDQTREACETIKVVQKEAVTSVSQAWQRQAAEALQEFEHSMQELAKEALERWRLTLASGLNAVLKSLSEQFQLKAESVHERENGIRK
jgi:hypothetical protein